MERGVAVDLPSSLVVACRHYARQIDKIARMWVRSTADSPSDWEVEDAERTRRRLHDRVMAQFRRIGFRPRDREEGTLLALAIAKGQYTGQKDPREWLDEERWLIDVPPHRALTLEEDVVEAVMGTLKAAGVRVVPTKARGQLYRELTALRGRMARAAQRVYDRWDPDEYGGGGICDDVASELLDVALSARSAEEGRVAGWAADHAWALVWNDGLREACKVDIPPGVYETGGGYSWEKVEGARFSPGVVGIEDISRDIDLIK